MCRMRELQSLKKALTEQKNFYVTLEDQLNRTKKAQLTIQTLLNNMERQIQQQFEEVTAMRKEMFSKSVEIATVISANYPMTTVTGSFGSDDECRVEEPLKAKVPPKRKIDSSPVNPDELGSMQADDDDDVSTETVDYCDIRQPKIILKRLMACDLAINPNRFEFDIQENLVAGPSEELQSTKNRLQGQQEMNLELHQRQLNNSTGIHRTANRQELLEEVVPRQVMVQQASTTVKLSTRIQSKIAVNNVDYDDQPNAKGLLVNAQRQFNQKTTTVTQSADEEVQAVSTNQSPTSFDADSEQLQTSSSKIRPNCKRNGKKISSHRKSASKISHKPKTYECVECNKRFSQACNLRTHLRIHTGEKPFKCNVCDVSFSQSGHLRSHLRIHTGEIPFKCNVCDVSCSQSGNLRAHLRIHTGEKPFKCNVCDVSFSLASNLRVHLRIHTGEKPFKCNVCDVSLSRACSLRKHLRIHTDVNTFSCDICKKTFRQKSYLSGHMNIHSQR